MSGGTHCPRTYPVDISPERLRQQLVEVQRDEEKVEEEVDTLGSKVCGEE